MTAKTSKKLYHATLSENDAHLIAESGFETTTTYFCSEIHYAAEFLQLTNGDGKYYVVEVDATKLDPEKLHESTDHNPNFYSKDLESFVYFSYINDDIISDDVMICDIWKKYK